MIIVLGAIAGTFLEKIPTNTTIKYWSVKYEYFLKNEYNKEIVKPFYDNKELENQANKQLT